MKQCRCIMLMPLRSTIRWIEAITFMVSTFKNVVEFKTS